MALKSRTRWRRCALRLLLIGGGSLAAATPLLVEAQQQGALEEVVVTGSRIERSPESYVGPMTVFDGDALQYEPTNSLSDALRKVPAIGLNATNRNLANGGRGAEFTEIHQLEAERTLVLMNGRRMVNTIRDTLGLAVDLQSFPTNMIDRVEVLADGASAVYGSDAVAGVVNVITKRDFDGFELSLGTGSPSDPGGDSYDIGALWGVTSDRGYFTVGATLSRNEDIDDQQRSWARDPILGQLNDSGTLLTLYGSGIPPEGRQPDADIIFLPDPATGASFQQYDTFCLGAPGRDGSVDCIKQLGHRYNYNDVPSGVSLINGGTVVSAAANGEYRFDNDITTYVELLASHRKGVLNFTPLPIADSHGRFTDMIPVPFDNPNIPADALAAIQSAEIDDVGTTLCPDYPDTSTCPPTFQMWWRALDAGARVLPYDANTAKVTLGFQGDFNSNFSWDGWVTGSKSDLYELTRDQVNVAKLRTAVDPTLCALDSGCPKVTGDNAALYPMLALGDPTISIFGRNNFTQEQSDYILFDDQERTRYEMFHVGGTVTGDLAELPAGTLGFAGGVEWRKENGGVETSGIVQAGDSGGNFAEPTAGGYDVTELYGEFSIPLISGKPGVEELTLEAAVRYSDYSTFGSETTHKLSLSYAPINSFRIRGVVSTGFRAPNVLELYGGKADSYILVGDPCSAPITDPTVAANCAADGVPPGFVQNASQLRVSQGGNPNLEPETSDNYSFGIVWTPESLDSLRLAVDYYSVEVDNAVATPEPQETIARCYQSPNLSAPECDRIDRGATGTVVRFDLLNENLNIAQTSGVDLNLDYTRSIGRGDLTVGWLLNYLEEYKEIAASGAVSDRTGVVAGLIADFTGYPEFRSTLDVNWAQGDWTAGVSWRRIDSMKVFDAIEFDNVHTSVDAIDYFDLHGSYGTGKWRILAGLNNATDEQPPYVPDVSVNTSAIYDFIGRVAYARATFTF
jgi:iron complex outermembrane receptor protein